MKKSITAIHYPIGIDAGLGKIKIEEEYAVYVEQLIKQVLFTNPGERINRPDFGCGLRRMVFAPNSDVTASLTQITVLQALEKWLDNLITVEKVETRALNEFLEVHISYILRLRNERRYLNVEVSI